MIAVALVGMVIPVATKVYRLYITSANYQRLAADAARSEIVWSSLARADDTRSLDGQKVAQMCQVFAKAATEPIVESQGGWPGRSLRRPGDGGPGVAVRASSVRGETFRSCSGASKTPPRPPLCNRLSRARVTRWSEATPR
jgi:hypothetical protein